jgi:hypothetical protein
MLDVLGIGEFDERVYRVLLAGPGRPGQEIATVMDAPVSEVRLAVTRLESFGLIRRTAHGGYQPAGPQTALMALLNQRRMEAETAFAAVQGAVEDLTVEYQAGRLRTDPSSLVEVLSGRDVVNRRVEELTRSISTHMWVLDKPPYLEWANGQPDTNETEMDVTTAMISLGVDIRAVYCPESMERPGRFDTVVKLAELGEQSRMLPSLPFKLRIMDRRVALVPLVGGIYDNLAVVHPSGLLDALMELFEAYWKRAVPIGTVPEPSEDVPGQEDLLLLRMLKAGLKDHAVARQLGISARTATRRIATIMERLGADTRFQAGVEAAKRGWL